MKTLLRVLFFWIKVLTVVLVVASIAGSAFFISMDVVNLSILIKDGMTKWSDVIFDSEDNDPDDLKKFFTSEYLATDELLNDNYYEEYDIDDYDYSTKIERIWCWPWQNSVTVVVSCRLLQLDGSLKEEYMTEEEIEADESVPPPTLDNTRYKVHCERIDNQWIITDVEFVETFESDDQPSTETAEPQSTPDTSEEDAQASQTTSGE